jgi:hypothetical protein
MKNIHLIATNEASRLVKNGKGELRVCIQRLPLDEEIYCYPQNVYITNEELPKKGDWCYLNKDGKEYVYKCTETPQKPINWGKKIILSTAPKLITDNIQPINDTFLEWFCKNSGCEWVEVENCVKYFNVDELRERHLKKLPHIYSEKIGYKIIIPEQTDEDIEKELFELEEELDIPSHLRWHNSKPKKESIESFANEITISEKRFKDALLDAAKWESRLSNYEKEQVVFNLARERVVNRIFEEYKGETPQKRMFSEEECYRILHNLMTDIKLEGLIINDDIDLKKWFEQIKKK